MREPILTSGRRRRARRARLVRAAGIVVVLVVAVGLALRFVGGGEEELPTPTVAFKSSVKTYSQVPDKPGGGAVGKEAKKITRLLDRWYQTAFVDPALWGDGTFPEVRGLFVQEARTAFEADIASLTIGEARTELERVVPKRARARISVFFDEDGKARFAVAEVDFTATGTPRADDALPLTIAQKAVLHLRKTKGGAWQVFAYDAKQNQDSVKPSPTP